jgi:hypothetical protein
MAREDLEMIVEEDSLLIGMGLGIDRRESRPDMRLNLFNNYELETKK